MSNVTILDAIRTPFGKHGGALAGVRPDDLAAHVLRAAVARTGIDPAQVDEVILGCANQAGEDNRDVARMAALLAGFPVTVPGVTVNRLCASGLEAVAAGARLVRAGEAELVLAGGVESMSRAPWALAKPARGFPRGDAELADTTLGWRFVHPFMREQGYDVSLGETAENVAAEHGVSRADQDAFALESHRRALAARAAGRLAEEIAPVSVPQRRGAAVVVDADEGPRADGTPEKLAALPPAFVPGGTVTAGNASTLNDGAACLVLASEEKARELGAEPLARVLASAAVGVDPRVMGIGPVTAVPKALARAGVAAADVGLVELNEAFAAQALACQRALGIPDERLNVDGGAIALGHPLGASGARLLGTLCRELRRRGERYGVATLCVGVGQGLAVVVENPAA